MDIILPIIDNQFVLKKLLGTGFSSEVYLAEHIDTKIEIAVKIYKPTLNITQLKSHFINEVKSMKAIENNNVIKILAGNNNGILKLEDGTTKSVYYMATELCDNGMFFDFLFFIKKGLCENTCRYYFQKFIIGLFAIHEKSIVHRDLKTENIFLDSNFELKIGDFGFSKFVDTDNENIKLKTLLGTKGFQSPEILEGKPYDGFSNDIFAAGRILFMMYSCYPPFKEASIQDPWYSNFINGNINKFWEIHSSYQPKGFFTESFKELVSGMLRYKNRLNINEVINSKWINEQTVDKYLAISDMKERYTMILNEKSRQEKNELEFISALSTDDRSYRNEEDVDDIQLELNRKLTSSYQSFDEYDVNKWANKGDNLFELIHNYRTKTRAKIAFKTICHYFHDIYIGCELLLKQNKYSGTVYFENKQDSLDDYIFNIKNEIENSIDIDFEIFLDDNDYAVIEIKCLERMEYIDFVNFHKRFIKSNYVE